MTSRWDALVIWLTIGCSACGKSARSDDQNAPRAATSSFHLIEPLPEHLAQARAAEGAFANVSIDFVSEDGRVAVGHSTLTVQSPSFASWDAPFRWTAATGTVAIGDSTDVSSVDPVVRRTVLSAMTPSGSVIVGTTADGRVFRWAEAEGMLDITTVSGASPLFVSEDGSVVVGSGADQPFRWNPQTGSVRLGVPQGHVGATTYFMSHDGSVIAGLPFDNVGAPTAAPFRWTEATGMTTEELPGCSSYRAGQLSTSVSYGEFIAGACTASEGEQAFIWNPESGFVNLGNHGLLAQPRAVSVNGSVVVGLFQAGEGNSGVFCWTSASSTCDGFPAASTDVASIVSDRRTMSEDGSVVIVSTAAGSFRWSSQSGASTLEPVPPHDQAGPSGVSGDGLTVVGLSRGPSGSEPTVWTSGGPTRVSDLLVSSGLSPAGTVEFITVRTGRSGRLLYGTSYGPDDSTNGWIAWLPP